MSNNASNVTSGGRPARISTVARLKRRTGEVVECACTFDGEEWALLLRYSELVDRLRATHLLSTPGRIGFSLGFNEEGPFFRTDGAPTNDQVSALLHLMRPFILQEATTFKRIKNLLAMNLVDDVFRRYIERQHEIFMGARSMGGVKIVSNDVLVNSERVLHQWLNAEEFHFDDDKHAILESLRDQEFLPKEFTRAVFIDMMLDKARAVVELAHLIRCLQRNLVIEPLPGDRQSV